MHKSRAGRTNAGGQRWLTKRIEPWVQRETLSHRNRQCDGRPPPIPSFGLPLHVCHVHKFTHTYTHKLNK